jgi:hypothetical protein
MPTNVTHEHPEVIAFMNEPMEGDFEVPSDDIVPTLIDTEGNYNLIVLIIHTHGNNGSSQSLLDLHPNCNITKISITARGCGCFEYSNTPQIENIDNKLKGIVQKYKEEIRPNNNRALFEKIKNEYKDEYLETWSKELDSPKVARFQQQHPDKFAKSNFGCMVSGKTDSLFEITEHGHLYNKYYSKELPRNKLSVIYDSRFPNERELVHIDTDYGHLNYRYPFAVNYALDSKNDQLFTLQSIYNYFQNLGFKNILIIDGTCDEESMSFPEGYRGGILKKRTKRNKRRTKRNKRRTKRTKNNKNNKSKK